MRLLISAILFSVFAVGSVFNAVSLWQNMVRRKKFPSPAVFIPGIAGVAALAVCPYRVCHKWIWLPLIIDPGCLLSVMLAFAVNARDIYDTNHFFRVALLRSYDADMPSLEICLFKSGRFVLKKKDRLSLLSGIGDWIWADGKLTLHVWGVCLIYDLIRDNDETHGQHSRFVWSPDSTSGPLDSLNLRQIAGKPFPPAPQSAYTAS